MVWSVVSRVVRGDGLLNLLLNDGESDHKVMGAPDVSDAEIIAWWGELEARIAVLNADAKALKEAQLAAGGPE